MKCFDSPQPAPKPFAQQTRSPFTSQRYVDVINVEGQVINPFGVAEFVGTRVAADGTEIIEVRSPRSPNLGGTSATRATCLNGNKLMAGGDYGQATFTGPGWARYEPNDGTPAHGEIWGAVRGDRMRRGVNDWAVIGAHPEKTLALVEKSRLVIAPFIQANAGIYPQFVPQLDEWIQTSLNVPEITPAGTNLSHGALGAPGDGFGGYRDEWFIYRDINLVPTKTQNGAFLDILLPGHWWVGCDAVVAGTVAEYTGSGDPPPPFDLQSPRHPPFEFRLMSAPIVDGVAGSFNVAIDGTNHVSLMEYRTPGDLIPTPNPGVPFDNCIGHAGAFIPIGDRGGARFRVDYRRPSHSAGDWDLGAGQVGGFQDGFIFRFIRY